MPDFTYGYVTGWARKGENPHYGLITPLYGSAVAEAQQIMADERGEIYVWIIWLTEFEGVGVTSLQLLWKSRNGVKTLMYNNADWKNADFSD